MKKRDLKKQSVIQLVLFLLSIFFLNVVASNFFFRLDLTSENRYSISSSTKKLVSNLKDVVYFKIYLEGDLPPGFKRLRNATKEMLDEFRIFAPGKIEYEFIDPSANPDEKERIAFFKQLAGKGLTPTNLEEHDKSGRTQRLVFPGGIITCGNSEVPLQLLRSRIGSSPDEQLNFSIEGLEYELASIIRKLNTTLAEEIGFVQGQGELNTKHITDVARSLQEFYRVDTVIIGGRLNALKNFRTIIIAKPDSAFNEKDKFIIDQFVMNGGRVFWLIDKMEISMDSLEIGNTAISIPNELNLDDQLFHYGVRINADLIMDLQAAPIPVVTGYVGTQPKQDLFPWYYFPLLNATAKHPIVHHLNAIKSEFISTLDTVEANGIAKTILLTTSRYSRVQLPPARVSLNILQEEPDQKLYSKKNLPVAVLLEGKFQSNYKNRIPSQISNDPEIGFREQSIPTKMIVVSDGDIISNVVTRKGVIYPLGYDRYTQQTYGNKNFILNCVDYLCDDSGTLELRSKEFKLRMFDQAKSGIMPLFSLMNVILPVLMILIFGIIRNRIRKKRFGSQS